MKKLIILFLFIFIVRLSYSQKLTVLHKGITLTHSATIKKQLYHFDGADSLSAAPIVIKGDNITIDFNGAVIEGSSDYQNPDLFKGTGVIIKSGKNITLKNLVVKGFKVGIMARGINNLKIINADCSYNFRQHLNSNRLWEDLADWQSYHHNEKDEWLRFGAGIYLRDCNNADIHNSTVTNGQCGLMMTNCNDALIYNNNFSFNSGLGIGMYRSSRNRIMNNSIDWNIRGFSDGVYYRGQDSAGILVFEQCNNNAFAYNSVTHSGDGFFLWAGQTSMDTGEGGCNDNLVYGNDFSYAATNAVEITFSRNKIIGNKLHDSWHGIWGGFSYNTVIANNDFAGNLSAIAIEHGKDNIIDQNNFNGDKMGIELWSNPKRVKDIGYLKNRDTRSVNYHIGNNSFKNVKTVFNINHTSQLDIDNNYTIGAINTNKVDSTVKDLRSDKNSELANPVMDSTYMPAIKKLSNGKNAMLTANYPQGKKYIMMNEWGPYNFNYPVLWKEPSKTPGTLILNVIAPAGKWRITRMKGVTHPSAIAGKTSEQITLVKDTTALTDIDVEMEYTGQAVTSPFGKKYGKGQSYTFHYREFDLSLNWETRWFVFNDNNSPIQHPTEFAKLLNTTPVKTTTGKYLNTIFGQGFGKGIAKEKIATVSASTVNAPTGIYRIGISASEIVRLYIDDKLIIDNWEPSKIVYDADYHRDVVMPLNGRHTIRVVQAQYADYGILNFTIQPVYQSN